MKDFWMSTLSMLAGAVLTLLIIGAEERRLKLAAPCKCCPCQPPCPCRGK